MKQDFNFINSFKFKLTLIYSSGSVHLYVFRGYGVVLLNKDVKWRIVTGMCFVFCATTGELMRGTDNAVHKPHPFYAYASTLQTGAA